MRTMAPGGCCGDDRLVREVHVLCLTDALMSCPATHSALLLLHHHPVPQSRSAVLAR